MAKEIKKVKTIYLLVHPYWTDFATAGPLPKEYEESLGVEAKDTNYSRLFKEFGKGYGNFVRWAEKDENAVLVFVVPKYEKNILRHLNETRSRELHFYLEMVRKRIPSDKATVKRVLSLLSSQELRRWKDALYSPDRRKQFAARVFAVRSVRFLRLLDFARKKMGRRAVFMRASPTEKIDGAKVKEIFEGRGYRIGKDVRIHGAGEQFFKCARENFLGLARALGIKPDASKAFIAESPKEKPKESTQLVLHKEKSDFLAGIKRGKFVRKPRHRA